METQSLIVDSQNVPWKSMALEGGGTVNLQMYLKGVDGGPEAIRARISEGYTVEPHFHLAAQFQLLLEGSMTFPTFRLDAPAVHYTEHNVPYGPFMTRDGHDMLVLHTKPGGVVMMRDKERRREGNSRGREFTCCAHEVEWEPSPEHPGARRKVLIPARRGPSAEMIECPPQMSLEVPAGEYGCYEVVYRGSVLIDGKELGPKGVRFLAPGQTVSPLVCGAEGATIIVLMYDKDAAVSYGGSTEEVLARMES